MIHPPMKVLTYQEPMLAMNSVFMKINGKARKICFCRYIHIVPLKLSSKKRFRLLALLLNQPYLFTSEISKHPKSLHQKMLFTSPILLNFKPHHSIPEYLALTNFISPVAKLNFPKFSFNPWNFLHFFTLLPQEINVFEYEWARDSMKFSLFYEDREEKTGS